MEGVSKETRLVKMTTEIHHTIKLIKCPVTFIRVKSKKKIVETFENFEEYFDDKIAFFIAGLIFVATDCFTCNALHRAQLVPMRW